MNVPTQIPNCPPGLEYLATVDQLLVHQMVELLEAFTGFETNNKYEIKNTLGQKVKRFRPRLGPRFRFLPNFLLNISKYIWYKHIGPKAKKKII